MLKCTVYACCTCHVYLSWGIKKQRAFRFLFNQLITIIEVGHFILLFNRLVSVNPPGTNTSQVNSTAGASFLNLTREKDDDFGHDGDLHWHNETGTCSKGSKHFDQDWLASELRDFLRVYNRRPGVTNGGGTGLMHQFALWCLVKDLKPRFIIESGVRHGHATWLMRQAAPTARMIMLDPNPRIQHRDARPDSLYLVGRKFKDFAKLDWSKYVQPKETLVFIDDHQNALFRTMQAQQAGFTDVIFDDNYFPSGDTTSLKLSCSVVLGVRNHSQAKFIPRNGVSRRVSREDVQRMRRVFDEAIDTYFEFPKLYNTSAHSHKNFLFDVADIHSFLTRNGLRRFPVEKALRHFANIAYVRLKPLNVLDLYRL